MTTLPADAALDPDHASTTTSTMPADPASHGCVRVTYPAMDQIWRAGLMPVGTPVWVY